MARTALAISSLLTGFRAERFAGSGSGTAPSSCLLYTSDAADERSSVDLGGRRIIKKKTDHADIGTKVEMTRKKEGTRNTITGEK